MPGDAVNSAAESAVAAECRVFSRFLAGVEATPYVIACYARLLPSANINSTDAARRIERALVAVGRTNAWATRAADSYARFFLPRSLLRRRLVLLLAILENSPVTERPLNSAYVASPVAVLWRLGTIGVVSVLSLVLGILVFAPLHLLSGAPAAPSPVARH